MRRTTRTAENVVDSWQCHALRSKQTKNCSFSIIANEAVRALSARRRSAPNLLGTNESCCTAEGSMCRFKAQPLMFTTFVSSRLRINLDNCDFPLLFLCLFPCYVSSPWHICCAVACQSTSCLFLSCSLSLSLFCFSSLSPSHYWFVVFVCLLVCLSIRLSTGLSRLFGYALVCLHEVCPPDCLVLFVRSRTLSPFSFFPFYISFQTPCFPPISTKQQRRPKSIDFEATRTGLVCSALTDCRVVAP